MFKMSFTENGVVIAWFESILSMYNPRVFLVSGSDGSHDHYSTGGVRTRVAGRKHFYFAGVDVRSFATRVG